MPLFNYNKKSKKKSYANTAPITFEHVTHVDFDENTGILKGLPPDMIKKIGSSNIR